MASIRSTALFVLLLLIADVSLGASNGKRVRGFVMVLTDELMIEELMATKTS